jgi:PAS domain S-box-containing protein
MMPKQNTKFLRFAAQSFLGCTSLALATFVAFQLGLSIAATSFLYLIIVVLSALIGSFIASIVISVAAALCLNYFFTPPIFSLAVENPEDILSLLVFLTTSLIVTGLVTARTRAVRRIIDSETALRQQASLLNLTHDSIFVRDMHDVITYWNRGAEEFYGWTAAEVVGKVATHKLLQTVFPAPLDEIDAELLRTDRWDGELVHTKADGTKVMVASRWSLRRHLVTVQLRTELASALPVILADRVELQQVIINLVMNGIDAGQSGSNTGNGGGPRRRDLCRKPGPPLQPLLHHQIRRNGHGTADLPFNHRVPWGTDVGRQQYWAGRDLSVHSTDE